MALVKICPACGFRNGKKDVNCRECDYDLMGVSVRQDEEASAPDTERTPAVEDARESAPEKPAAAQPSVGRRCASCGKIYPIQTFICPKCNLSLSAMPIVRMSVEPLGETETLEWHILSPDQRVRLVVRNGERHLLGRDNELAEYLAPMRYVGRKHASFAAEKNTLTVTDENSTNGVQVNARDIPAGKPCPLKSGDVVSLGGKGQQRQDGAAYFQITSNAAK